MRSVYGAGAGDLFLVFDGDAKGGGERIRGDVLGLFPVVDGIISGSLVGSVIEASEGTEVGGISSFLTVRVKEVGLSELTNKDSGSGSVGGLDVFQLPDESTLEFPCPNAAKGVLNAGSGLSSLRTYN